MHGRRPGERNGQSAATSIPSRWCGYCGALTTTYVTDDPENDGWYQVAPHCSYVRPLTVTALHDGGIEWTTDPTTAAVVTAAAVLATGW